jgi:hypothetical protein
MTTKVQFKLRYSKSGKLLTQIHHYRDFTVLISSDGIKAHYRIKNTGTRMWGFDLDYPTVDTTFLRCFRTYTAHTLSESEYEHLAKQITLYQLVSP